MDRYGFDVHLTPAARELLRPDEALVLDWYRLAICCAGAGEASLYAMKEEKAEGRRFADCGTAAARYELPRTGAPRGRFRGWIRRPVQKRRP